MFPIIAFLFLTRWLVSMVNGHPTAENGYLDPRQMKSMGSNCPVDSIWKRREPLFEIIDGFSPWPMVTESGIVSLYFSNWPKSFRWRTDMQGYTRIWKAGNGYMAILYAYFSPVLQGLQGNLRYFIIWFRDESAVWSTAYACSSWGWDKNDQYRLPRWVYYTWDTCKKDGEGDGDAFRIKIVMDGWDLWPSNASGVQSHLTNLLNWDGMPQVALDALKGERWAGPTMIFDDDIWDILMRTVYEGTLQLAS